MNRYDLAQLNIAVMKYPIDSAGMAGFVDNLEPINAIADSAPGFVWRLQTEDGDATGIRTFGPDTLVNMSVWRDIESLHGFVYRTAHAKIVSRRKEWFEKMDRVYNVLWWVPRGSTPSLEEARERLYRLKTLGPTPDAFTFKTSFPHPEDGPEFAARAADRRPST